MTAHYQIAHYMPRTHRNRKDHQGQQRGSRRQDIGQAFLDAGFEMVDHSKFQFTAFELMFYIRSSLGGLIAEASGIIGVRFPFGTPPKVIADKLKEVACLVLLSWQESDEYQSAWERVGLSGSEVA